MCNAGSRNDGGELEQQSSHNFSLLFKKGNHALENRETPYEYQDHWLPSLVDATGMKRFRQNFKHLDALLVSEEHPSV